MTSPTAPLTGSIVALVTPMHEDGSLDWDRYRALIEFHIAQQTDGLVVVGYLWREPGRTTVGPVARSWTGTQAVAPPGAAAG